jgi:hypothetical protein
MIKRLIFSSILLLVIFSTDAFAQRTIRAEGVGGGAGRSSRGGSSTDAQGTGQEMKEDSIIYTSKYIRYTNLKILKDGTLMNYPKIK